MILGSKFFNSGTSFPSPMGGGNDGDLFWRTDQRLLYFWDSSIGSSGAWISVNGVPVGTISAWTNHIVGTPVDQVDAGLNVFTGRPWHVCDGSTVADAESPINGQSLPNLNSPDADNNGMFLRGNSSSGTSNFPSMPNHKHDLQNHSHTLGNHVHLMTHGHGWTYYSSTGSSEGFTSTGHTTTGLTSHAVAVGSGIVGFTGNTGTANPNLSDGPSPNLSGSPTVGTTRDVNRNEPRSMDVLWIMRIK